MTAVSRDETHPPLAELVDRLARIVHGLQFTSGLNPAQWEALRYIGQANKYSRTPGALADYLGTTKGTASQTVIALESKGYICRSKAPRDGRSVSITLTPKGWKLLKEDPLLRLQDAVAELSPKAEADLSEALGTILVSIQGGARGESFGHCGQCCHFHDGAAGGEAGNCYCGLTDELLTLGELVQICADFQAEA